MSNQEDKFDFSTFLIPLIRFLSLMIEFAHTVGQSTTIPNPTVIPHNEIKLIELPVNDKKIVEQKTDHGITGIM